MKTLLLTLLFAAGIAISGFAQSKSDSSSSKRGIKFSIGYEIGVPVGNGSGDYKFVTGGSAKLEVPTSRSTYLTVSAGYNVYFLSGTVPDLGLSLNKGFVPLKAGLKCYTGDNFFVEAQAGIVWSTESGGGHAFAWSPGIGYTFKMGLEIGARYEGWTNDGTVGQISGRIAYRF